MDTIFFPSICLDYTAMWFSYSEICLIGILIGVLLTIVFCYFKKLNFSKVW